jgi:peptide chain release factor subunit 1
MLGDEFGTASNIKNRVNRQSVLGAITSAQQRLKLYNKVPPNGLVLYTGTIVTDDGKEKKVLLLSIARSLCLLIIGVVRSLCEF